MGHRPPGARRDDHRCAVASVHLAFPTFLSWVNRIANTLVARTGVEPVENAAVGGRDADTIRHLVEYSTQVGVLEPELRSQITGVIELQALTVDRITVPASRATLVKPALPLPRYRMRPCTRVACASS